MRILSMRAHGWPVRRPQDQALWRRSRNSEAAEDEAERFLDLAGFADARLDAEDSERVAELLARDPAAAADVAAARALAVAPTPTIPDRIFERASALVGADPVRRGQVVALRPRRWGAPNLQGLAQWGSLAAAIVMAGWLGFALGADASISFTRAGSQSEDGFLHELLDPSTGFLRDLTEGVKT
jgi:anti-sigma factor RsiW